METLGKACLVRHFYYEQYFRRHKFWTHEEGIATPMIAYLPSGIKLKGEFQNSIGHLIDFLPTFLELGGVELLMKRMDL